MKALAKFSDMRLHTSEEVISVIAMLVSMKQVVYGHENYTVMTIKDSVGYSISYREYYSSYEVLCNTVSEGTLYDFSFRLRQTRNGIAVQKCLSITPIIETEKLSKLFRPKEFIQQSPVAFSIVESTISKLPEKRKRLAEIVYGLGVCPVGIHSNVYRQRQDMYRNSFASINHHDNYSGGYIIHIASMITLMHSLYNVYVGKPLRNSLTCQLDWGYITLGILLHDIGKPITYDAVDPYNIKYKQGCRLNHNMTGVIELSKAYDLCESGKQVEYSELQALLFLIQHHDKKDILSTSGKQEDQIVHLIDSLEAACADSLRV